MTRLVLTRQLLNNWKRLVPGGTRAGCLAARAERIDGQKQGTQMVERSVFKNSSPTRQVIPVWSALKPWTKEKKKEREKKQMQERLPEPLIHPDRCVMRSRHVFTPQHIHISIHYSRQIILFIKARVEGGERRWCRQTTSLRTCCWMRSSSRSPAPPQFRRMNHQLWLA